MANSFQAVPISEMVTSADPDDVLVVYGLGSCVAVCLYDPVARVGGILHALLPGAGWRCNGRDKPGKFVDRGVPLLVEALLALGAKRARLEAHLCGGAQVMATARFNQAAPNIGQRNTQAARLALQAAGLKVKAEATGGDVGRTVKLYLANGQVIAKTLGREEQVLA